MINYPDTRTIVSPYTPEDVALEEAKRKNTSPFPMTHQGRAHVGVRIVNSNYLAENPLRHTSQSDFTAIVERFLELNTDIRVAKTAQNLNSKQLDKLKERVLDMEKYLKVQIGNWYFLFPTNGFKTYGLIKKNDKYTWGTTQEEIMNNMGITVAKMQEEGRSGEIYTLQDYIDLYQQYSSMVRKGFVSNGTNLKIKTKNEVADDLDMLFRCIMHSIKANYPENWEAKAIEVGFLKNRNS
jgi:hypothetical protein